MNTLLQPYLESNLIIIRALKVSDFELLYTVASDPLIWEQHHDKKRHTAAGFKRFFEESLRSGGALSIVDVTNKEVIGASRYKIVDAHEQVIEIGWTFLSRKYWGGQYNRHVKRLMTAYALKHFKKVVFYVNNKNLRSQMALEKLGAIKLDNYDVPWVLESEKGITYLLNKPIH